MMKKIFFLVIFLFGISGTISIKALSVNPGDVWEGCLQEGDSCCYSIERGSYCEGMRECGPNNLCTKNLIDGCGKLDEQCCSITQCDPGLICINSFCQRTVEEKSLNLFYIDNLTDYPKDDNNKLRFVDGNVGGIVSFILKIVYWLAGLSMLAMIIAGGFQVATSIGIPEKSKMGYGKITGGIVGFLIVFSSYMIVKLVETMFNIKIL
jgi:hypothetical protein